MMRAFHWSTDSRRLAESETGVPATKNSSGNSISTLISLVKISSHNSCRLTQASGRFNSVHLRLLQKLRAQHQALDLVGAAFDLVGVVGEVNAFDHGAALEHRGGALQLQVFYQRDAVALGEQRAVGIPDLDVHAGVSFVMRAASLFPPLVGRVAHRERSERCDGWGAACAK